MTTAPVLRLRTPLICATYVVPTCQSKSTCSTLPVCRLLVSWVWSGSAAPVGPCTVPCHTPATPGTAHLSKVQVSGADSAAEADPTRTMGTAVRARAAIDAPERLGRLNNMRHSLHDLPAKSIGGLLKVGSPAAVWN